CSLTPPDPTCDRKEADLIAAMKPAYVIAPVAPEPAFYDELTRKHIVVAGGEGEPAAYHADADPYYWDVFMDGTRATNMLAEYVCKRLGNKPVKWAGFEVEHPDGNPVGPVPIRKFAISFPENNGDPTYTVSAKHFISLVTGKMCNIQGGDEAFGLAWAYFSLMASTIQNAGPLLTPENMRQGLFTAPARGGWVESHGDQNKALIKFDAPDDYTGIDDSREVWWCSNRPSEI